MELITKLRAKLDETERLAREAIREGTTGEWYEGSAFILDMVSPLPSQKRTGWEPQVTLAESQHIARHDPKAVLELVDATRVIVELHEPRTHEIRAFVAEGLRKDPAVAHEPTGAVCYTACPSCGGQDWDLEREAFDPCLTLRALAKGYGIEAD